MKDSERIVRTQTLTEMGVQALIQDDILVLVVENYYPVKDGERLAQALLGSADLQNYTHEVLEDGQVIQKYYGVDRLGFPFNLLYGVEPGSEIASRYYEEAESGIRRLREFCQPALTPIDKLRLELDERFSLGGTVAAFQGRKMLAGIGRVTRAKLSHLSAEQPHFDALPNQFASLDAQLAANIYLKVPDVGGELEIWDVPPVDPLSKIPTDWRSVLPDSIKLKTNPGELVIFNCRRPHAIGSFTGEDRVTMQMFVGYIRGQPLMMWN